MELQVIGYEHATGRSKNTNQPYEICNVYVLVECSNQSRENRTVVSGGYKQAEIPATANLVNQLIGMKFPKKLAFQTDTEVRGRGIQTVLVALSDQQNQ